MALGGRAQAVFAASSRVAHAFDGGQIDAAHVDVVLADTPAQAAGIAAPAVVLCEAPALAVPTGFSKAGLPLSMQIVGKPFDEAVIYQVAHAYEQATRWTEQHPSLAA